MTKRAAKISDAARAFMAATETAPPLPDDLSYPEQRRLIRQAYTPAANHAIQRHNVSLDETEIAGVHCTRVTPQNPNPDRQIIYIFGGGFCVGSPFEDMPIIAHLAATLRCVVICPHYRLAPEHPFPAALNDVEDVATVLFSSDIKTAMAGESAGGNLALALYHRLRLKSAPLPVAMAVMSPATDTGDIGDSGAADRDPLLKAARVEEVNRIYPVGVPLTDPEVSPIYADYDASTPPTFITTGTRDLFLSNCVRLERVMRKANANVTLRVWEGMGHVFEFFPEMPEADDSLSEIAGFLDMYLAD